LQILKERPDEELKEDSKAASFKDISRDIEIDCKRRENANLEKSIKITQNLEELNMEISQQLVQDKERLKEVNKEAEQAAEISGQALKEVKKKAKGKWWLFGLKTTLFGGGAGAVAGTAVGLVPGAVIGGVAGATGGAVVGSKIKKAAKKKIDVFQEEDAIHIDPDHED